MTGEDRVERERKFHNDFFSEEEARASQLKYYFALDPLAGHYDALIRQHARSGDVLEYGCGLGTWARSLAKQARSVVGIDLSDVAMQRANEAARRDGISNVHFRAMNAENMSFPDNSFDLVFGSGILHHLDLGKAIAEIHRVLKPGGVAIFQEPLGHNPIINAYRRYTPGARTQDEHPLLRQDFRSIRKVFPRTRVEYFVLSSLACVPFGRNVAGRAVRAILSGFDSILFLTPLRWWAWYALMLMRKPKPA